MKLQKTGKWIFLGLLLGGCMTPPPAPEKKQTPELAREVAEVAAEKAPLIDGPRALVVAPVQVDSAHANAQALDVLTDLAGVTWKMCSPIQSWLRGPDMAALSAEQRSRLEALEKNACGFPASMAKKQKPVLLGQIATGSIPFLKTVASCRAYRGPLGDAAARRLAGLIEKEKNQNTLRRLKTKMRCPGEDDSLAAYSVAFDDEQLAEKIENRLQQLGKRGG